MTTIIPPTRGQVSQCSTVTWKGLKAASAKLSFQSLMQFAQDRVSDGAMEGAVGEDDIAQVFLRLGFPGHDLRDLLHLGDGQMHPDRTEVDPGRGRCAIAKRKKMSIDAINRGAKSMSTNLPVIACTHSA